MLIHGHPFSRRMWGGQLDSLSDRFRVVAPDLPGYGESPPRGETITPRGLADAVVELMDAIGVERATVVGLSLGGLVAMELGLGFPDRVDGLVLTATTAAPLTPEEAEMRRSTAEQARAQRDARPCARDGGARSSGRRRGATLRSCSRSSRRC